MCTHCFHKNFFIQIDSMEQCPLVIIIVRLKSCNMAKNINKDLLSLRTPTRRFAPRQRPKPNDVRTTVLFFKLSIGRNTMGGGCQKSYIVKLPICLVNICNSFIKFTNFFYKYIVFKINVTESFDGW